MHLFYSSCANPQEGLNRHKHTRRLLLQGFKFYFFSEIPRQEQLISYYKVCGIETTIHYLIYCPNYLDEGRTLLDDLQNIGENIHDKNDFQISELFLFGISLNHDASKTSILNATIQFILATIWRPSY